MARLPRSGSGESAVRAWKIALISSAATLAVVGAILAAFVIGRGSGDGDTTTTTTTTQNPTARATALAKQGCEATRGPKLTDADIARSFAKARANTAEAARLDPQWSGLQSAIAEWDDGIKRQDATGVMWNDPNDVLGLISVECQRAGVAYSQSPP
jgi:hypothetical protein